VRRFLVVAPNGGASLGQGGGSYVAMKIVEALSHVHNSEVVVASLWGASPETLARSFGLNLPPSRVRNFCLFQSKGEREPSVGAITTPYLGAVLMSVVRLLQRAVEKFDPDLVVFNDDVPRWAKNLQGNGRKSLLYSHFPYACRLKYRNQGSESNSLLRRASEIAVMPFMKRFFETDATSADWVVANSSVTRRYVARTFNNDDVTIMYPPVDIPKDDLQKKSELVVSIGAIQPNKRFLDVVEAVDQARSNWKYVILGHLRDVTYYKKLVNTVKKRGLENRVHIIPDAGKKTLSQILARSKAIVHASRFEPFGISVVEGMGAGAVPVVYNGEDSGPWIDIVARGRFGLGYRTNEELATLIDELMFQRHKWLELSNRARERARFFSTRDFSENLIRLIGQN